MNFKLNQLHTILSAKTIYFCKYEARKKNANEYIRPISSKLKLEP